MSTYSPMCAPQKISIHAPHARSDVDCGRLRPYAGNFNPRSSCEERRGAGGCPAIRQISIHAPHARSDSVAKFVPLAVAFQSTLLMRGATALSGLPLCSVHISIHAPHARSDTKGSSSMP